MIFSYLIYLVYLVYRHLSTTNMEQIVQEHIDKHMKICSYKILSFELSYNKNEIKDENQVKEFITDIFENIEFSRSSTLMIAQHPFTVVIKIDYPDEEELDNCPDWDNNNWPEEDEKYQ